VVSSSFLQGKLLRSVLHLFHQAFVQCVRWSDGSSELNGDQRLNRFGATQFMAELGSNSDMTRGSKLNDAGAMRPKRDQFICQVQSFSLLNCAMHNITLLHWLLEITGTTALTECKGNTKTE